MTTTTTADEKLPELRKPEIVETRTALQAATDARDAGKLLEAVQRVVAHSAQGLDMSPLYPDMVKACNTREFAQKKLVYVYLCEYGRRNADLALLAVNTLRRDALDASPLVRGLAVRSMGSLRLQNLLEYFLPLVLAALADTHPYVRRAAVFAAAKLHPLVVATADAGARSHCTEMLRRVAAEDADPQTCLNAICALRELERDYAPPLATLARLLACLRELEDWAQCQVLALLALSGGGESEDEDAVALLNALDDRLQDSNSAVVLSVVELFLRITRNNPDLHREVLVRTRAPLLLLADTASAPEITYAVLMHLRLCASRFSGLFEGDYVHFFVRPREDPAYVRLAKIELLALVASEQNARPILEELEASVPDADAACARAAISAIGNIARKLPPIAADAANVLRDLLAQGNEAASSSAALASVELIRRYPALAQALLPTAVVALGSIEDPDARAAVLWAIGEHGAEFVEDAPYVLEHLSGSWSSSPLAVKHALLVASVKLLLARPAEARPGAGRVLASAAKDETSADLRGRAATYYRMLQRGPEIVAASVIATAQDKAATGLAEDHNSELEEKLFSEFNTLSVVVGKPFAERAAWAAPVWAQKATREEDEGCLPSQQEEPTALLDVEQKPLSLVESPTMDPATFQKLWGALPEATKIRGKLAGDIGAFVAMMKASRQRVVCIAAGIVNDMAKVYAFAQLDSATRDFCLVEVIASKKTNDASLTIKCQNKEAAHEFATFFRNEYLDI